ncbi:methyltransferase [Pseudoscourfieldia marina]
MLAQHACICTCGVGVGGGAPRKLSARLPVQSPSHNLKGIGFLGGGVAFKDLRTAPYQIGSAGGGGGGGGGRRRRRRISVPVLLRRSHASSSSSSLASSRQDGGESSSSVPFGPPLDLVVNLMKPEYLPAFNELFVATREDERDENQTQTPRLVDCVDDLDDDEPASSSSSLSWFTQPWAAALYATAYRPVFRLLGYPGVDDEALLAAAEINGLSGEQSVILDLSCGPGIFTQRLADLCAPSKVVGVDFSRAFCEAACRRAPQAAAIVRADVSHLPFQDACIDGIHAAAAIHCWPDVPAGVSECVRILKPGRTFFASTVTLPPPTRERLVREADGSVPRARSTYESTRVVNSPFFDTDSLLATMQGEVSAENIDMSVVDERLPCFVSVSVRKKK